MTPHVKTPDAALQALLDGNARYVAGEPRARDLAAQRAATAAGQNPFASVLACIDSRVAPELVFDQGIGDVFVARVAGNFVTEEILGSLEFASGVVGAKAILVLGHSDCGAVKGACDGVQMGHLTTTLSYLKPAIAAVGREFAPRDSSNEEFVAAVAHRNVALTVDNIRAGSAVLRRMEQAGDLVIAGGMYDVATGRVSLLG